jgi:gliding motility-associated-like protein
MAVSGFEKKIIPQINISSSVTQICSGVPVQFTSTVTSGGTLPALEWRVNGTVAGTGATFSATNLTDSSKITCTLTSNADCAFPLKDTSNQITIRVIPRKVPQLRISGADTTVCQGKPIRFLADTFQSGKNRIQWFKNFLPVGTDSVRYTLNQGIAGDRIFAVLYSQEICRTRDSVVSNLKTAKVTPVYTLVVQAPDTVYLDETPVILAGQPSFGKFTGFAIEDTLFYPEIAGVGVHLFQYEIPGNLCTEPVLRTIVVRKRIIEPLPCAIEPATLLTPNGDGANENWVVGIFNQECILSANVEIFNRWGKSVYSKDQYQNDWVPGKDLSEGVYYFTISYNTPDKTIRKTGTLWLTNR